MKQIICPVCRFKDKDCIVCKGKGKIDPPKPKYGIYDKDGIRRKAAIKLKKRGYALREIAKLLGYKNPQSIQNLLKKK